MTGEIKVLKETASCNLTNQMLEGNAKDQEFVLGSERFLSLNMHQIELVCKSNAMNILTHVLV